MQEEQKTTEPSQQPEVSVASINSAKKFNWLVLAVVFIVVILLSSAGTYYFLSQRNLKQNSATKTGNENIRPTSVVNTSVGTENWKTYFSSNFGYSIKYPTNHKLVTLSNTKELENIEISNTLMEIIAQSVNRPPCQGDCKTEKIQETRNLQLNNINFKKITGFTEVSQMGGYFPPQTFIRYETIQNGNKYEFTTYELNGYVCNNETPELCDDKKYPPTRIPKGIPASKLELFLQMLSTLKFTNQTLPTATIAAVNNDNFISTDLGVSFNYDKTQAQVKQVGNKIYVYANNTQPESGQWVEVFPKDKSDSLKTAIEKKFLTGYSPTDCFVELGKNGVNTAIITVPALADYDLSKLSQEWQKCPEKYVTENGISYFLDNPSYPDKFAYFSIGQYAIMSGESDKAWQDTFKFIK